MEIKTDNELLDAITRTEELWGSPQGTPSGDELDVLLEAIRRYEQKYHPVPLPDDDISNSTK